MTNMTLPGWRRLLAQAIITVPIGLAVFLTTGFLLPDKIYACFTFAVLIALPITFSLHQLDWSNLVKDKAFVLLLVFGAYMATTVFWGTGWIRLMRRPAICIYLFLSIYITVNMYVKAQKAYLLFAWAVALFGLYLVCGGGVWDPSGRLGARGVFDHPIALGTLSFQASLILMISFFESPSRRNALCLIVAMFLIYVGILAGSRGPILGLMVAGTGYCVYRCRRRWKWLVLVAGTILAIIIIVLGAVWLHWEKKGRVLRPGHWCKVDYSLELPAGTTGIELASDARHSIALRDVTVDGQSCLELYDSIGLSQDERGENIVSIVSVAKDRVQLAYEIKSDTYRAWQAVKIYALPSRTICSWVTKNHILTQGFSSNGRAETWSLYFESIRKRWLLGWGIGNAEGVAKPSWRSYEMASAHSLYIGVLYSGGLVGLFLMLAFMGTILWRGRHHPLFLFPYVCALVHCISVEHWFFQDPDRVWYLLLLPMFAILAITVKRPGLETMAEETSEERESQLTPTSSDIVLKDPPTGPLQVHP